MTNDEATAVALLLDVAATSSAVAETYCLRLNHACATHVFGLYWYDHARWVILAVPRPAAPPVPALPSAGADGRGGPQT